MHPLRCAACFQSRVHPKTRTPVISVLFCGAVSAVLALFVPLDELADLTSMGALFAFCVVSAGVLFRWVGVAAVPMCCFGMCCALLRCAAGLWGCKAHCIRAAPVQWRLQLP